MASADAEEEVRFDSDCLVSGRYDAGSQVLTLVFVKRGSSTYGGVPPDVWEGLKSASSAGRYFNSVIRPNY